MLKKPDLMKPAFIFNKSAAERIRKNLCATCGLEIKEKDFKDTLSKKEFSISGMCQHCQDTTFK